METEAYKEYSKKKITIVVTNEFAKQTYLPQIQYFFGDYADVECEIMKEGDQKELGEIVLYRVHEVYQMVQDICKDAEQDIYHMIVTFSKAQIRQLETIPEGENILLVNTFRDPLYNCIEQLEKILPHRFSYTLYVPGDTWINLEKFRFAVTMVEPTKIDVPHTIHLGGPKIHWKIFRRIVNDHFMDNEILRERVEKYRNSLVPLDYYYVENKDLNSRYESSILRFLELFDEGIIALDRKNVIKGYNAAFCSLCNIGYEAYKKYPIQSIYLLNKIFKRLEQTGEGIRIHLDSDGKDGGVIAWKRIIRVFDNEYLKLIFVKKDNRVKAESPKMNRVKYNFANIVHKSQSMHHCIEIAKRIANSDNAVLITGETGTGKELLAHAIHNYSHRSEKTFIAVNCAAFSDSLLESELFGYEKGSFTGALKEGKKGVFEQAEGGTVFLDEIGDAPKGIQTALLRVLQEKEVRRVGGTSNIPINVRIISATNKDLKRAVSEGDFRKDLYYRLNVFHLRVPSLRERREDIPNLVMYFMSQKGYAYKSVSKPVMKVLEEFSWEGNIRELQNCVEYFCVMSGDVVQLDVLPEDYCSCDIIDKDFIEAQPFEEMEEEERVERFVLSELFEHPAGRRSLMNAANKEGMNVTENDLKKILKHFREEGFIVQQKGRGGARITAKGIKFLNK